MSLLPPNNFRGQPPMAQGAQHHYMPKQPEVTHFIANSEHYHHHPCSTIENWATPSPTGPASYHHPEYQLNSWAVGSIQGYSPEPSHTSRQLYPQMGNHPYGYSVSQPSNAPAMAIPHHAVQPERRSFHGSEDSLDWSVGPHQQQQPERVAMTLAPSPAFSTPSYHSFQLGNSSSSPIVLDPDHDELRTSSEEEGNTDPPYSLLIYQALLSAPGRKLPLQGIYNWFEKNTEKGKDQSSKGWQNSIRHNLSMNAGFEAVKEETDGKRAVNYWRLTPEALKNGIQSTTRYRKLANQKKALSSEPSTPQRQRPSAKAGKAGKASSKIRHAGQDERHPRQRPTPTRRQQKDLYRQNPTSVLSVHVPSHAAAALVNPSVEAFDLRHVVGCTDYSPTTPIFCDMAAPQPDYFGVDVNSVGWCGMHSIPSGLWTGHEVATDHPIGV